MTIIARQLTIKGKVQGVFYRTWTVKTAQALGLTGWVRNRLNGDVEALVQGEQDDVERFLILAWSGPSAARVDEVADDPAALCDLSGFEQRATA